MKVFLIFILILLNPFNTIEKRTKDFILKGDWDDVIKSCPEFISGILGIRSYH